ncbi:MAG: hypothetical protein QM708_07200 [Propioniciclava sp.]|uniref:hypothetical protein n=1 Tax=Propioniciclava sp. TaxID=2038686 RepID=UPI0039E2DB4E
MRWSTPVDVSLKIDDTITVNTTSGAAANLGILTAVGALTCEWSHPNARTHEEPGSLSLTLRYPTPGLIHLDSKLHISCRVHNATLDLGSWWVESVHARRTSDAWIYKIAAANAVGRAAGIRLAASPWPAADVRLRDRIAQINHASPIALLDPDDDSPEHQWLVARDVDAADALEIIHRTASSYARLAVASSTGIALVHPDGTHIRVPRHDPPHPPAAVVSRGAPPAVLSASRVEDAGRDLSRRGLVTVVRVTFYVADRDTGDVSETSRNWRSPQARHLPTASLTIDTDLEFETTAAHPLDPSTVVLPEIGPFAAGIAGEGTTPRPVLTAARLAVGLDDVPWDAVLDVRRRTTTIFFLDPVPADLDPAVYISAGTIEIAAGQLTASVTLAPAVTAGIRPMRWSDWPTPADVPTNPRPRDTVAARFEHCGPLDDPLTLADQIRIIDTRVVDAPTSWRTT